jgi:asparagine synthase (glutamine-hydrolysing)
MHFSSIYLGEIIGVRLKAPFLDEQFVDYAKSVQTIDKVGEYCNSKWGKFLLRKCYEKFLGERIAWRPKLAQEQGAGITSIQDFISRKLDDRSFALGKKDALFESINISNKEHLYYYLLYRKYFKPPRDEACKHGRRCPKCKGCFVYPGQMCRTCGAFPVSPEP